MLTIRSMLESDADAVRQVDRLAFLPLTKKLNPTGPDPIRRRENVLAALGIFPQGCFVAEDASCQEAVDAGGLAGYIFSRAWGAVGWVGVFGVHPERQGGQVGKRLLAEACAALEAAGCTNVGLETMPDSSYNIGLYARRGFRPVMMTLVMEKTIGASAYDGREPRGLRVIAPGDVRGLESVTAISRAAWAALDLRAEAANAAAFGWGEALLLEDGKQPWAAAVMRLAHRREEVSGAALPNPNCEIGVLASLPEARTRLGEAVQRLEGYAAARGFRQLRLSLNSADWQSLRFLLDNGYRVVHSALRFLLKGDYTAQPGLEFSRWAM